MRSKLFRNILSLSLCLCILLGISLPVSAAPQSDPMVMVASEDPYNGPAAYRYNAKGQLIKKTQGIAHWEYAYHSNGELKKEAFYQKDELYEVVEYDNHGNIKSLSYPDDSGKLQTKEKYTNRYDLQGRLTSFTMISDQYSDQEATFLYHEDGSFTVDWTWYQGQGEGRFVWMHRTGTFAANGRQLSHCMDVEYGQEINSQWQKLLDSHGNPVAQISYLEFEGFSEINMTQYRHTYDEAGLLLSTETYVSYYNKNRDTVELDEGMELEKKTVYFYDSQGRKIKETTDYSDFVQTYFWQYDSQGNLTAGFEYRQMSSDLDVFLMRNGGVTSVEIDGTYEYLPLSEALKLD